jgi:serine/threonine protein kinase/tetratricopeptide (TPR) repeat protein
MASAGPPERPGPIAGDLIGETASHYRILQRLGDGAMGEVYLAEDLRLHRTVALKMLRPEVHADEQARARLLREARAASALNHPNIAVIYELDEVDRPEGPLRFIAMEYVAGETLGELARQGRLDLDAILSIGRQIADALAEAHARGVVHRDVKPTNVMVTGSGRVKVLDFGLALHQPLGSYEDSTWTRDPLQPPAPGSIVGTLAYMAPEQALGKEVDGRADVFSLGALLYELLASHPPFQGRNAVQVLDALLHQDPPVIPPRFDDPRLPRLEALVRQMLAKEPASRPSGMRELAEALSALQQGALALPASRPFAAARSVAVLAFANITRNGDDDWLGTGIAETLTADLKKVSGLEVLARERIHETLRRLEAGERPAAEEGRAVQVGRELGARWVLSGGFQRAGDAVRVTARLTEVATGSLVHTVKVDGKLDDIFSLQDRLVNELSAALRLSVSAGEQGGVETQVLEAYEAFSRGVINLRMESYEALDRAVFLFERAVALDPGYARAHLELGSSYASKADFLAIPSLYDRAIESFRRALDLRPDLVRGWRELGGALVSRGREDEGIQAISRGLERDGEDAGALAAMGRALFVGQARFREAVGYYERALQRNPQAGWYALQLSHCLALLREFERGEAVARKAVELQEGSLSGQEGVRIVGAYMRMGHLASLHGRDDEAVRHFQCELGFLQRVDHALRSRTHIELNTRLGASLQRLGQAESAAAALRTAIEGFDQRLRLGADEPFTRYYAACAHALAGNAEAALAHLERAAAMRRLFTVERARIEPELETVRAEPRFRRLVGD